MKSIFIGTSKINRNFCCSNKNHQLQLGWWRKNGCLNRNRHHIAVLSLFRNRQHNRTCYLSSTTPRNSDSSGAGTGTGTGTGTSAVVQDNNGGVGGVLIRQPKKRKATQQNVVIVSTVTAVSVAAAAAAMIVAGSFYSRKYRTELIETLPLVQDCMTADEIQSIIQIVVRMGLMGKQNSVKEELEEIRKWHIENGYKGGLVLRDLTQPLDDEIDDDNYDDVNQIRSGTNNKDARHVNNNNNNKNNVDTVLPTKTSSQKVLNRRECYYLYYEVKPTGTIIQQIFCRGTTIRDDISTCLQSWMVYDNDCECYVHKGFRDHANRILIDVLPLLVATKRSTVEVCGHSLGGAVASILSIKLKNRGYKVTRLTTVAEPRYILFLPKMQHAEKQQTENGKLSLSTTTTKNTATAIETATTNTATTDDVQTADDNRYYDKKRDCYFRDKLPKQYIRIENDTDFVPYLPPFGTKVGTKIWLTNNGSARYISGGSGGGRANGTNSGGCRNKTNASEGTASSDLKNDSRTITGTTSSWWTDSVWFNFYLPEIIMSKGLPHRIPTYVHRLQLILDRTIERKQ